MNSQNIAPLKIAIVGPPRVGKTVISNTLSDFSKIPGSDYRPTVGCRILEFDKEFTDDQIRNINYLKSNNLKKIKLQVWDVSGDNK
jgi:GTPase SAR1 family protein